MARVLEGVTVLEFGAILTAPYATLLLAELGARVIKIERPDGGDVTRAAGETAYNAYFCGLNRNKESLTLDVKAAKGREILHRLAADADVFVENFRSGVAERLGIGAAALQEINPRLIYCSITGFGDDGPYANRPCHDAVAQALSGYLSQFLDPANPRVAGPSTADTVTGIFACYGILGALFERERTGKGRRIDVSMLAAATAFANEPFSIFFGSGHAPEAETRAGLAQCHVHRCADGAYITLHLAGQDKFFLALLTAIDRADLKDDPRFSTRRDRTQNFAALKAELAATFATQSRDHWLDRLAAHDLPFAPLYRLDEVADDPQVRHMGLFYTLEHEREGRVDAVRRPVAYDGERDFGCAPPPTLGEQTDAVLGSLGLSEGEIVELRRQGVV